MRLTTASSSFMLAAVADALTIAQPKATLSVDFALDGMSPMPTLPPMAHEYLHKRASGSSGVSSSAFFAPDNTCGFIDGRVGAAYQCFQTTQTCVLFPPPSNNAYPGFVGCCAANQPSCIFKAACIDYDGFYTKSECNDGCAVDTLTLKCTGAAAPYCNTVSFEGGIHDYWCNSRAVSTAQLALESVLGGEKRPFRTITLSASSTSLVDFETSSDSSASGASQTSSAGQSSASPSTTSGTSNGGSGDNGNSDNNTDTGSKKKKSTPVGPIVGGVVGGVAAIGLVGIGLFFFLRRRKNTGQDGKVATPSPQTTPMQQHGAPQPFVGGQQGPPMQQPQQGYYNNPNYAAPGVQPYPSPDQHYGQNQQLSPGGYYPPQQQPSPVNHNNSTSPTVSQVTDPRASHVPTSPTPSYGSYASPGGQQQGGAAFQPQEGVIHEVPASNNDNHRGEMHELG